MFCAQRPTSNGNAAPTIAMTSAPVRTLSGA
jgi:hypothetical protein